MNDSAEKKPGALRKWLRVGEILHIGDNGVKITLIESAKGKGHLRIEAPPEVRVSSERPLTTAN